MVYYAFHLCSMPGGMEWLIIIIAILILFGGKKTPEFMRGLGKGIKEFTNAKDCVHKEFRDAIREKELKPSSNKI